MDTGVNQVQSKWPRWLPRPTSIRRLKHLQRSSSHALSQIRELLERYATNRPPGAKSWGQFCETQLGAGQQGVYGTSAAIQALLLTGVAGNNALITGGRSALPEIAPIRTTAVGVPEDLKVVMKCAAILEAATRDDDGFYVSAEPIEARLTGYVIDGRGWGDHSADSTVRLRPTLHALVALAGSRTFRSSALATSPLDWVSAELTGSHSLLPADVALCGIVLLKYQTSENAAKTKPLIREAIRQLRAFIRRDLSPSSPPTHVHFAVPDGPDKQRIRYMFYLGPALAASFLLSCDPVPWNMRHFVVRTVEEIVANIAANNGYKAPTSPHRATVDQLTASRVLSQYLALVKENPNALITPLAALLGHRGWTKWLTGIVLAGAGCAASAATFTDWSVPVRAIAATVASITFTALATLIAIWWDLR